MTRTTNLTGYFGRLKFIFIIIFFSQFYLLILDWLRNKLHDLFFIIFYRVITVSKKYLFLNWCKILSIYFYYIIKIKKIIYKKFIKSMTGERYQLIQTSI